MAKQKTAKSEVKPVLRRRSSPTDRGPKQNKARFKRGPRLQFEWAETISSDQWEVYRTAIHTMREAGIPFLLGGGFALAIYTGRWRNTKDIDFYIRKHDRQKAVATLTKAGFADYFSKLHYDRKWIYRSTRSGVIVDIIWAMANQRAETDELWFQNATPAAVRGESLHVVPMEEFLWCKVYILQRDHCDWTDVFNLLYAAGEQIDWNHLLGRLGGDDLLLKGLLSVYDWLCPRRAAKLPIWLRKRLKLGPPQVPGRTKWNRIRLLDSRGWFAAELPERRPLEI